MKKAKVTILILAIALISFQNFSITTSYAATTTFDYSVSTQTFTVPAGVVSLSISMRGGAGGMGGTDGYAGGDAGRSVGSISGTITVTPGQVITVAVGQGGGSTSACVTNSGGGTRGNNPLTGYDGGTGGNAGTTGCSGGGGGGGAATVLQISGINVVAAGGGGSGGGNNISRNAVQNSTSGSTIAGTTGSNGVGPTGDGGGGGGGGGGATAGAGGTAAKISSSAEFYGYGGNAGTSSTGAITGLSATTNTNTQSSDGSVTFTYTADTTAPIVSSVSSNATNNTYKAGTVIDIRITFSEAVTVTGTPRITLETGATDRAVNYSSGSGTTVLIFNYTVQAGDTSGDLDYVATNSLALNGGTIEDAAGNRATLTLAAPGAANSLGANKALVIDTTAPTISSAALNSAGTQITLTYNETLSATTAATSAFAISDSGTAVSVSSVSASGFTVTLTLALTINIGRVVTISYTDPTGLDDANVIQDSIGNDASSLSSRSVTNNSTVKSNQNITFSSLGTSSKNYPYSRALSMSTTGSSGSGAITYAIVAGGSATSCTLSNSSASATISATTSGTCLVAATVAADVNYNSATSSNLTFTFNKASQATLTITTTTAPYGNPMTLETSGGNGGGAVSYAYAPGTTTCTLSSGVLTPVATGTCLITATKASDTNYLEVTSLQTTITFTSGSTSATITFAAGSLVFREAKLISVTASVAGRVTFRANGKVVSGCIRKVANQENSLTASCSYRPSTRGNVRISVTLFPTNSSFLGTTTSSNTFFVYNRSGARGS